MTTSILIIILGIISSATLVLSALSVHKRRLLIFGILTGSIVGIEYWLAGSVVALGTLTIGLAWNILTLASEKYTKLAHWGFVILFISLQIFSFSLLSKWSEMSLISFIPLLGGVGGIIAIHFKKVTYIKATLIFLGLLWLIYEFHSAIYSQMIGESLNLIANIAAFVTLNRAAKRGIPESQVEDLDERFISTITKSIPISTLTGSIHLPNGNKVKMVAGAHPASVGYTRLLAEHKNALKR